MTLNSTAPLFVPESPAFFRGVLLALILAQAAQTPLQAATDDTSPDWGKAVRPILLKYCAGCHNPADAAAGLSLQTGAGLQQGSENGAVLDRDVPENSRLWEVLHAEDESRMPPNDEPQPTAAERAVLREWLSAGAPIDDDAAAMLIVPSVPITAGNVTSPLVAAVSPLSEAEFAAGTFGAVEIRRMDDLQVVRRLNVGQQKVTDLQAVDGGTALLVASGVPGLEGSALLVDSETGEIRRQYGGHADVLYAARCSPNGSVVATAGYDRVILLHDRASGQVLRRLTGHNGAVFDLDFSPDGTLLASASADATVKIWKVESGERMDTLSQPLAEQYAVRFSADGNALFAAGADNRIRKYQVVSRTQPAINPLATARFAHERPIISLEVSPDGRWLVTASEDRCVKTWDAATVTQYSRLDVANTGISCVGFSTASDSVLIGTSDGGVRRNELQPGSQRMESAAGASETVPSAAVPGPQETITPVTETEVNNAWTEAQPVSIPTVISGVIESPADGASDADCFSFEADAGQQVYLEVDASRSGSPLDSRIDVLDDAGQPVLRTLLQAQRDSWFTFRGKDSDTSDDFRLFNWQEMELNEYLYSDGEVVRLWLYPRGPDSGFKVYPGFGRRYTYFGTTPTSHALQAPAFIVRPFPPGTEIVANGLPVFPVHFENDDDPLREWGSDSRLMFTAPASGRYVVRIRDAREFGGSDYSYRLTLRTPRPDFRVSLKPDKLSLLRGTGREMEFTATRIDGFSGPIEIRATELPAGLVLSEPIVIQEDQLQARAAVFASDDVVIPESGIVGSVSFTAHALIGRSDVQHDVGAVSEVRLETTEPRIRIRVSAEPPAAGTPVAQTAELTIHPGETLRAWVGIDRNGVDGAVSFGKEDSGRNLPHGIFVDNIGLNGLLLPEGQTVREVFITAAPWVPETDAPFHLRTESEGGLTSRPVILHVRNPPATAGSQP